MSLTLLVFGFAAIVVLTGISAFFSSSELAVFSISSHRIESLAASNTRGAAALAKLREDPHRFLVTALVSNNIANIAAASVATAVLIEFLPANQAATGATVFTSLFVIVFGEIAPKSYAVANAERHALRISSAVVVIQKLLYPVLIVFETMTGLVNRVTGGDSHFEEYLTREEIETMVLSGERTGVLGSEEGAMIRSVLDLGSTTAQSVMIPRTAMVSVATDTGLDEVIERFWNERVTQLPVFEGTRDNVQGFVDIRDALRARAEGNTLEDAMTEAVFVPVVEPVDALLAEMQRDGHRMAMAVDEFGTVVGVVTLEDVVEEVVGELYEYHEQEPIGVVDGEQAEVDGWATVEHVNEALALDLPTDGPFETVAGLVAHRVNRLGETGDRITLDGVVLTVLEATERGVTRVRLDWGGDDDGDLAGNQDADRTGDRDDASAGGEDEAGSDNPET